MNEFSEITVHTTSEGSELVADAMWQYTDFGVNICDVNDIVRLQKGEKGVFWDYIDDTLRYDERADVLVKCYVSPEKTDGVRRALREDLSAMKERAAGAISFGSLECTVKTVDGDEWIEVWKEHFRPIPLGKIVVVPEWIEYQCREGEKALRLDSNMAFGTGEHETTSMCVEWLQEYMQSGSVCIDVGCGSGILGICAALLGAKHAYLTDIDPVAVDSARHNAALNGVADRVSVDHSDLLEKNRVQGDIILANITAEVLCLLAGDLNRYLKEGGVAILSGILSDRVQKVKEAYAAQGLFPVHERTKGEWVSLVLRRKV